MRKGMALPVNRGKATEKEVQEVEAKERDKGTTGHDLHELTLKVSVKGLPNQHSDEDKKKGTKGSKGKYNGTGEVAENNCKSSLGVALIKKGCLEKKREVTKEDQTCTESRSRNGNTVPDHTTYKGERKEAFLANKGDEAVKQPDKTGDDLALDVKDYLHLLKILHIDLPEGVLSPEGIKASKTLSSISDARLIITELEKFEIQFCKTPRLSCRDMKRTLALKNSKNVLELTKIMFFETRKEDTSRESLEEIWRTNSTNTGRGFRMRDRYTNTSISMPAMYFTTITRSWTTSVPGDNKPKVTDGARVNIKDVENMTYSDESLLSESGLNRFGRYHQNKTDEVECLKFFHELGITTSAGEKVQYTRGNKVEYGFLSGRLDFLAQIQKVSESSSSKASNVEERLVIECKGTTGDMVGKLFTKAQGGKCQALLNETHKYCYQTQAYMYILKQDAVLLKRSLLIKAVMVIRHYHDFGKSPQDFYWNYLLLDDNIQKDIDELRTYCQKEVLACFLAVLDLIFQKEIT